MYFRVLIHVSSVDIQRSMVEICVVDMGNCDLRDLREKNLAKETCKAVLVDPTVSDATQLNLTQLVAESCSESESAD